MAYRAGPETVRWTQLVAALHATCYGLLILAGPTPYQRDVQYHAARQLAPVWVWGAWFLAVGLFTAGAKAAPSPLRLRRFAATARTLAASALTITFIAWLSMLALSNVLWGHGSLGGTLTWTTLTVMYTSNVVQFGLADPDRP